LDIKYDYDEAKKLALVTIEQGDKLFNFPVKINVYVNGKPETFDIWIKEKSKTFAFKADRKPQLIDFDVDKTLIAQITENKTIENYIYQYQNAKSYENRREAIEEFAKSDDVEAIDVLISALNDDYYGLRIKALQSINLKEDKYKSAIKIIKKLANNDEKTLVRAAALKAYSKVAKDSKLYEEAMKSKSFAIKKVKFNYR